MAKRKTSPVSEAAAALGRRGGQARAQLSPDTLSEIGRKGAAARWAGHKAKRPASARKRKPRQTAPVE